MSYNQKHLMINILGVEDMYKFVNDGCLNPVEICGAFCKCTIHASLLNSMYQSDVQKPLMIHHGAWRKLRGHELASRS